jgi:thioester reductase-like protein
MIMDLIAVGFLGAVFVEKILRTQPGIRCIFVLLRAKDVESAKIRFKNEVRSLCTISIDTQIKTCDYQSRLLKK